MRHLLRQRIAELRHLNSLAWSTATWAARFTVQLVLGAVFIAVWLLGKAPVFASSAGDPRPDDGVLLVTAAVITAVGSVGASALLIGSPSSRVRGVGLALGGSSAVVLVGVTAYAFLFLRW